MNVLYNVAFQDNWTWAAESQTQRERPLSPGAIKHMQHMGGRGACWVMQLMIQHNDSLQPMRGLYKTGNKEMKGRRKKKEGGRECLLPSRPNEADKREHSWLFSRDKIAAQRSGKT